MKSKIHLKNMLKSFAALAMLSVYFTFLTFQNYGIILERADHDHEICTPELELDSCHRHVFHHDEFNGCDHKDHIHPPKKNKQYLKAVVSPHPLQAEILLENIHTDPVIENSFSENQFYLNRSYLTQFLRGPPTIV
ncbi:MAG: hypothetical protein DWQ02_25825 [Bacteroidetes bacterium]|nr:MAG: hypothetical protein DWQ02_25825 [Bacteroidota bacterium]